MVLPTGWERLEVVRKNGLSAGKIDIYIKSPGGKIFRSKKSLEEHIKHKKLPLKIKDFNFTTKKTNNNPNCNISTDNMPQSPDCESCNTSNNIIHREESFNKNNLCSPVKVFSTPVNIPSVDLPCNPSLTELLSPYTTLTPHPPKYDCVEKENKYLRQRVIELEFMVKSLTDRAIDLEIKILNNENSTEDAESNKSISPIKNQKEGIEPVGINPKENCLKQETKSNVEIKYLQDQIKMLSNNLTELKEELRNKTKIISILTTDCENLSKELSVLKPMLLDGDGEYLTPKLFCKQKLSPLTIPTITSNKFICLSEDSPPSLPCEPIHVQAQIHRSASPIPSEGKEHHKIKQDYVENKMEQKRKIIILTDSQGKEFQRHLNRLSKEFEVFVYCSPGAKLKYIIQNGLCFSKSLTDHDYLVVLAGSNDTCKNEPAQLTIAQGLKCLLTLKNKTNILIHGIPYRYDDPSLNDNISFYNSILTKTISNYEGDLSLFYGDVNSVLGRSHFTKHGLHYNKSGKALLGRLISQFISDEKSSIFFNKLSSNNVNDQVSMVDIDDLNIKKSVHNQSTPKVFPKKRPTLSRDFSLIELFPETFPNRESLKYQNTPYIMSSLQSVSTSSSSLNAISVPAEEPDCTQNSQLLLNMTSTSEPWGGASPSKLYNSEKNFLDYRSWPNLVL